MTALPESKIRVFTFGGITALPESKIWIFDFCEEL